MSFFAEEEMAALSSVVQSLSGTDRGWQPLERQGRVH